MKLSGKKRITIKISHDDAKSFSTKSQHDKRYLYLPRDSFLCLQSA